MNKHIAVLMGGWSSEREVSISSGLACAEALEALGFQVSKIDVDHNIPSVLAELKPDDWRRWEYSRPFEYHGNTLYALWCPSIGNSNGQG